MRILSGLLAVVWCFNVSAQNPFADGNVVVLRVGSPDSVLSNRSREVFLHEYTPAGNLVQVIAIPHTGDAKLTITGTSSLEGVLNRSSNGEYLVFGGYRLDLGTSSPNGSGASADRAICRVGQNGIPNLETMIPYANLYPNISFRAVTSADGYQYWTAGGGNGVRYALHGSDTSISLSTTSTNLRSIGIQGRQLYIAHSSGTVNTRIMQVGDGLPTDSTGALQMNGLPTTSSNAPTGFFLADLSDQEPGLDVLYVADEFVGLSKYSLIGGVWIATGIIGSGADNYRSVTGVQNGQSVTLYATRKGGTTSAGGGELITLTDNSGFNGTLSGDPTVLATAVENTAFRGVAMAPKAGTAQPDLYIFTGAVSNEWDNAANWQNGFVPPLELPAGKEIILKPKEDGEYHIKANTVIKSGARLTIAKGKQVILDGNLVIGVSE